jgi:signal peptidase
MVLKRAGSVLITIVLILAVLTVIIVAAGPLFGVRTNIVLSGSMEPAISTGSIIITRPISPGAIEVGDIITYASRSGTFITTHRVIGIEQNPDLRFITKGDANRDKDPAPISPDQVLGKLFLVIPGLGYLISYIKNPVALIILIVVPLVIVLGFELDKRWVRGEK